MSDLTFKKERTPTCSVQRFGAFQHQVIEELVRTYPAAQTMRWRNAVYVVPHYGAWLMEASGAY